MSTKRILGIAFFGVLFIVAVIGVMLLTTFLSRDNDEVQLPDISAPTERPGEPGTDALNRVEVTRETVQIVVSTLLPRPVTYSRDVLIESFWENGHAAYNINVSVDADFTSLRIIPPVGIEKRIIVTPENLYIWYRGDRAPYIGDHDSSGDEHRTSDEYQMLITFEDILGLDINYIVEADYTIYEGEECIYVVYLSPIFGYTVRYYISIDLGLVIAAEEYDETGELIYRMVAGECIVGEVDPAVFTLPDGTDLRAEDQGGD
jgi:hypothetical protein